MGARWFNPRDRPCCVARCGDRRTGGLRHRGAVQLASLFGRHPSAIPTFRELVGTGLPVAALLPNARRSRAGEPLHDQSAG
jgi:hypothetical protein